MTTERPDDPARVAREGAREAVDAREPHMAMAHALISIAEDVAELRRLATRQQRSRHG